MAPELLASKKNTEMADVYSFAVVCWELLSRACPYEGLSQIQVGGTRMPRMCVGYFPLKRRQTRFFTVVDNDNLQCLIFSLLDSVDNEFIIDRLAW